MSNAKFVKEVSEYGLSIPLAAFKLSEFENGSAADFHTLKNTVVVLKKRMTALELIGAIHSLQRLSADLFTHLAMQCGPCEACDGCNYEPEDFALDLKLPDELREKAGFPKDAVYRADVDDGVIIIRASDDIPGLRDVPPQIMNVILAAGLCPEALEEYIMEGKIVYGND